MQSFSFLSLVVVTTFLLKLPFAFAEESCEPALHRTSTVALSAATGPFFAANDLPDIEQIFSAFKNGYEVDFKSEDQRQLFLSYLSTQFGDPKNLLLNTKVESTLPRLFESHEIRAKENFQRAEITGYEKQSLPTPELVRFTQTLIRNAGQRRSNLMEIDANIGYWEKLLGLSREALAVLVPKMTRDQIRLPAVAAEIRLESLAKLMEQLVKTHDNVRVRQALLDVYNLAGFMNAENLRLLRSSIAEERLEGLQAMDSARDHLALQRGYKNHFNEVKIKLFPGAHQSWFPASTDFANELKQLRLAQNQVPATHLPLSSTIVRPLSISESSLRSCLGGSDCSSDTYFDFAFNPEVIYFTMEQDGRASGVATLILGRAGRRRVAFLDKLQNVPEEKSLLFLETIRQILAQKKYQLAFETNVDNFDHDGLSNTTSLTQFLAKQLPLADKSLGRFQPVDPDLQFPETGYSRILDNLSVTAVVPPAEDSLQGLQIRLFDSSKDFVWPRGTNAKQILERTLNQAHGTDYERRQYLRQLQVLINLDMTNDVSAQTWLQDTALSPTSSVELKVEAILFTLRYRKRHYTEAGISLNWHKVREALTSAEAVRTYGRLTQIKDLGDHLPRELRLLLVAEDPEKLQTEIERLNGFNILFLLKNTADKNPGSVYLPRIWDAVVKHFANSPDVLEVIRTIRVAPDLTGAKDLILRRLDDPSYSDERVRDLIVWAAENLDRALGSFVDLAYSVEKQRSFELLVEVRSMSPAFERSSRHRGCFPAGANLDTPTGPRAIETLRIGDEVLSRNDLSGDLETQKITAVFSDPTPRSFLQLKLADGRILRATPEHPFYDPEMEIYRPLGEMQPGEAVLTNLNGFWLQNRIVALTPLADQQGIFNIEVENNHNYLVDGVLVHNKPIMPW